MNQLYPFEAGLVSKFNTFDDIVMQSVNDLQWYPGGDITTSKLVHKTNVALFHWGPAYLIDFLMFCFGQKRL